MKQAPEIFRYISRQELAALSRKSDARAFATIGWQALLAIAAFALAIAWPNPLTVLVAIVILGGRIQAFGIITHDCAHGAFFRTPALNRFVGKWVSGAIAHVPLDLYRRYHLDHHRHAGTAEDPDRWMVKSYPVTRASLKRKLIRDVTGQTGFRDLMAEINGFKWSQTGPSVLFHAMLFVALLAAGAPWAYAMWWAARIFVYPATMRLRQISEHGVAKDRDHPDARVNTGTTIPHWWEALLFSPCNVNYHVEHHIFASVPPYRLPALHRLLASRGYYAAHDCIARGFSDVLTRATRPTSA
ncbi:fatty acid desaturase [Erythrobacter sp. 3-20A1M]|uniref:fatty acid desaturase family protein n=1 Tax=Erythrobacter sp. 3-20A1M TaxID=2653850 RepID=UPI001BFBF987|nr:fatty acid desaturase family protein [Erythrobacter sp. 3-20A1M]QWC57104.1 fatty acid desaturase [Erythrobacter sp. 3-20A1M]